MATLNGTDADETLTGTTLDSSNRVQVVSVAGWETKKRDLAANSTATP